MAGDLLKKLTIATRQSPAVPAVKQQQPAVSGQTLPAGQSSLHEYKEPVPLSAANITPTGITPHSPNGYLLKENIFQSAKSTVKSYGQYAGYLYNAAVKGEGTDYSVGKINDLTIRAGSLGIAGILAATKAFPFAKGMEFVGLTTWFASMMVWPKVIGKPVEWIYGVNPNLKYVDSYGRRKSFFEDPQYLSWDLFRHIDKNGNYNKNAPDYEYLNLIGDKLGIPRNIENRHEAIQDKMRQIATQTNALWMLTAGVMTPVISSIVADAAQTPLSKIIEVTRTKKQEKSLAALETKIDKVLEEKNINIDKVIKELGIKLDPQFEKELNTYAKDIMKPEEFEALEKMIEDRFKDTDFIVGLKRELDYGGILTEKIVRFDNGIQKELVAESEKAVAKYKDNIINDFISFDKYIRSFCAEQGILIDDKTKISDVYKKLNVPKIKRQIGCAELGRLKAFDKYTFKEFNALIQNREFTKLGFAGIESFNGLDLKNIDLAVESANYRKASDGLRGFGVEALNVQLNNKVHWLLGERNAPTNVKEDLSKFMLEYLSPTIDKYIVKKLNTQHAHKILKTLELYKTLVGQADEYAKTTIKDITGSATANSWEKIPQKYLKLLGFNEAELAKLALPDSRSASELLAKKFESLVKNPQEYERIVKEMTKLAQNAISKEEKALVNIIGTSEKPGILTKIKNLIYRITAQGPNTGNLLADIDTYYRNTGLNYEMKVKNTINSFGRPLKAMDTYGEIDKIVIKILGPNVQEFLYRVGTQPEKMYAFKGFSYEKAKEALGKFFRKLALENNDINNWSTKYEAAPEGLAQGFRWSLDMCNEINDFLHGGLTKRTAQYMPKEMVDKFDANSLEMGVRYSRLESILADGNIGNKLWSPVEEIFYTNIHALDEKGKEILTKRVEQLEHLAESRRFEISEEKLKDFRKTLNGFKKVIKNPNQHFNRQDAVNLFHSAEFIFDTNNRRLSKQAGKDVADFFIDAARNTRSRNKWTKLVWGLFGGTAAVSALTIALMGKKNYFNKDIYAYKGGQNANRK